MSYETEFRRQMDIIGNARRKCTIYSASYISHYWYPFKLRSVGNGWDALDGSCMDLIIDSDINDESITNREVLEEAVEVNANIVIPKDYIDEPEKTRQSLIEFEEIIEQEFGSIQPIVMPVLQNDHISHLKKHEEFYNEYSHIALGGLIHLEPEDQARRLKKTRDILGDKTHIHGLGMGASLGVIKAIRQNPNMIDSLDMSTAEKIVRNGNMTDWAFNQEQPPIPMPYGEDKTTVNAGFSKSLLVMLNYMLTDLVDEDRLEELFYDEIGLHKLEQIIAATEAKRPGEVDWSNIENNPHKVQKSADGGQQRIENFD